MKKAFIGSFVVGMLVSGCCSCSCEEDGFVLIFNGKDLTGWQGALESYGVDPSEPGVLQCFPDRVRGKCGNLCTEREYADFILRFEFMMPENGNNGLGVRVTDPAQVAAYDGLCEIQLLDDGGSLYYDKTAEKDKLAPYQYTGSVYGVTPSRRDNSVEEGFTGGGSYVHSPGMWNAEEVKVVGSVVEVRLNGELVTTCDLSRFKGDGDTPDGKRHPGIRNKKGFLGWQGHGDRVRWRNIRIKEL